MRWHVQGMRRRRRDLGVRPCCWKPKRRQLCAVTGMNNVMRHSGMIWLALVDWLEYCDGAFLIGVRSIGRWRSRDQRQRVEDLRLVVLGKVMRDRLHGALVLF